MNENSVAEMSAIEQSYVESPEVVTPDPVPVELPELLYTYQPTDDLGRPLGGKQVIKYRTPDELATKLRDQNIELVRKLREVTRKNRLGIVEEDQLPEDAPRFNGTVEFKPRELSADDRVRLSRDLSDPDRFGDASSTLIEATLGAKPEVIRDTITNLQITNQRILAQIESDAFMAANPSYHKCPENAVTITDWLVKNNLSPVRQNFQLAYDTLKAAGLLLEAPIVREEVPSTPTPEPEVSAPDKLVVEGHTSANSQPVQVDPSRITMETPAQTKRPVVAIPTGLTRDQAADTGVNKTLADEIVYEQPIKDRNGKVTGVKVFKGLAAIERMPSDEYGRRLRFEPGFRQKVEKLENTKSRT